MKKTVKSAGTKTAQHDRLAMIALAFVALVTLAGADVFSAPEAKSVAHANTSANPYQPVRRYDLPFSSDAHRTSPYRPSSASSLFGSTTLIRKMIVLERSVRTIGRQLHRVESRMDAIGDALASAEPKNILSLRSTLDELTVVRDRLEQRLAEANAKLERYRLQQ